MAKDITLKWEWPADRSPEHTLLIEVDAIDAQPSGVININTSPSFAENVPEPTIVSGTVVENDGTPTGELFSIVVPGIEVEALNIGSIAEVGILNSDVCIYIEPAGLNNTTQPSSTQKKFRSIEDAANISARRFRDNAPIDIEEPEALASGDMNLFIESPSEFDKDQNED